MSTEFGWERNSLSQVDTVSGMPYLIDKDMVRESISKMKNGKAAGTSGAVPEMVKTAGEAGLDIMSDQVNEIMVGVIPTEWKLSTIVN